MVSAVVPRFGWTWQKPPDNKLELHAEDVLGKANPEPSDAFVEKVVHKLVGDADETPRFIEIPHAKAFLGSWERVEQFQDALMRKLDLPLQKSHPELFRDPSWREPISISGQPIPDTHHYTTEVRSCLDDVIHRHFNEQLNLSPSYLHWDYRSWPVIAFHYRNFTNILGGIPRIFDARQMARDARQKLCDVVQVANFKLLDNPRAVPEIKPNLLISDVLEKYTVPVNIQDESIFVVNNHFDAGIAHGPTTSYKIDPTQPASRPMFHTQLQVNWKHNE